MFYTIISLPKAIKFNVMLVMEKFDLDNKPQATIKYSLKMSKNHVILLNAKLRYY